LVKKAAQNIVNKLGKELAGIMVCQSAALTDEDAAPSPPISSAAASEGPRTTPEEEVVPKFFTGSTQQFSPSFFGSDPRSSAELTTKEKAAKAVGTGALGSAGPSAVGSSAGLSPGKSILDRKSTPSSSANMNTVASADSWPSTDAGSSTVDDFAAEPAANTPPPAAEAAGTVSASSDATGAKYATPKRGLTLTPDDSLSELNSAFRVIDRATEESARNSGSRTPPPQVEYL
jgi:hypothetical protein